MEKRIYWLDNQDGKFKGGFYVRCNLFEYIKQFEKKGYKVIGIQVDDSWNLEFICEEPENKEEELIDDSIEQSQNKKGIIEVPIR